MKISLVGYMGAGKSAIGKKLSSESSLPFLDLDDYIIEQEKKSISSIFQEKGEIYFRKIEHNYLKEVLGLNQFILSTGGGTPVFYNHMDLINRNTISFYLHASPTVLAERLSNEKSRRPLISHLDDDALEEFIAKHLFERNIFYQKAHYTISTQDKSIQELVDRILELIKIHQNLT